jgi:predicted dehydrogenase
MNGKLYNWAIIGPGKIAQKFASDLKLLPNANLYAVGSRNIDRAKSFASQYNFQKAYGSYLEVAEDPDVDIVYIASPHVCHYKDSLLFLNSEKAVLCEKPVAINEQQCQIMLQTAKKNNAFFMEALWTRFVPSFNKCIELIEEGEIGEVNLVEANFCINPPYEVEGRIFNPMLGGGSLLDIGLYPVFLSLEILGKPEMINAMATLSETGVDSSCSMLFKNKENKLSVLSSTVICEGGIEAVVHGSEGIIRLNSPWHIPTTVDLVKKGAEPVHYKFIEPGYGYQYEAEEVMKCLDDKKIESSLFGWQKSIDLISTLDEIRKRASIVYPSEIENI